MNVHGKPRLVVVVGPIAAGKSTLAAEVARRLRDRGESVAVVGVDEVADMAARGLDWTWAHQVHGRLVRAWLATPVQTVVADGPGTPQELGRLMRSVPGDVGVLTVVVDPGYEPALRRARQDPERELFRDAAFLRRAHDRFHSGMPELTWDLALDSGTQPPATLADRVLVALDERRGAEPRPAT